MLDANQIWMVFFFAKRRHRDIDVTYLTQFCFYLPKRTFRYNSNSIVWSKQTLKNVENVERDIGFDTSYDEFKQLSGEARKKIIIILKLNFAK